MKVVLTIALYAVLLGLIATRPRADDIDIYRAGAGAARSPLRVMLALDLRAEAAQTLCADASVSGCKVALGDDIYSALDLFGVGEGSTGQPALERSADGVADLVQVDPDGSGTTVAASYWAGVAVDRYDVLRAALRVVLTRLGTGLRGTDHYRRIEVGLMALHGDTCAGSGTGFSPDFTASPPAGCSQGAYVLRGFTDISDSAGLDALLLALAALPDPGRRAPWMAAAWPGHPYKLRDIYLELHRYLTGQRVFNAFLGTSDYGSRASGNLYHGKTGEVTNDVLLTLPGGAMGRPLLAPDSNILLAATLDLQRNLVAGAEYLSPIGPDETCATVAMVHLQQGTPAGSRAETNAAIAAPAATGGLGLSLAAGGAGDRELVASMAANAIGVPVRSYFFHFDPDATAQAMAVAGGTGRPFSLADTRNMVAALEAVFAEAKGEGRALVAAATVVNEPGGSRAVRDIYFPLFRAESGSWWSGNLKKLKIVAPLTTDAYQPDRDQSIIAQAPLSVPPSPAIAGGDGQILRDALTFWTDPTGADVQAFDPGREEVSGRDGRSVTRGGAGQQITGFLPGETGADNRDPGARQLFTLHPNLPGELLGVDASLPALSLIKPYIDPDERLNEADALDLIRWIRGWDSFDMDGDGDPRESRGWLLGALLHSRPLALSYGARPGTSHSAANPDVRIFFGTNDGVLHVVQNTSPSGAESGRETWAFIPPESLAMQATLARNRVSATGRPGYGLDGEPVSLIRDIDGDGNIEVDDGDRVLLFIGQRRGGRGLYAFDMSDPDKPRYLWMISHAKPGFGQLALTFSTPRIARLDLGEAMPTPVLIFAGGYNGGWNGAQQIGKDAGAGPDSIGNAIYVVDPASGRLIWRAVGPDGGAAPPSDESLFYVAALEHSIPAPLTVIDSDRNGVDDRAYVGDSGGNVWRLDMTEYRQQKAGSAATATSHWRLTRIASLGGTGESDRRFFHPPDVVQSRDLAGEYNAVVLASGNRAAPLQTGVRNFVYLVKDREVAGNPGGVSALQDLGPDRLADITELCRTATGACAEADTSNGWRLELQAPGEKGLSAPLVSNGRVLFTSYVPSAGATPEHAAETATASPVAACVVAEGHSRLYGVTLQSGSPALSSARKIRFPPEGEQEIVEQAVRFLNIGPGLPGDVVPIGDGVLIPGAGLDGDALVEIAGRTWWRAYWREEAVDTL